MAIVDSIQYSVCEDCYTTVEQGYSDHTTEADDKQLEEQMKAELGDRKGHWVSGVEPCESDPHGSGYVEFNGKPCELCRSKLAGSRHGVTLLIEDDK